jgi:DNA-binding NarL/FixJ family response regulator
MPTMIIVDDHNMFRESLRKILTIEKIADVLAEASNGAELMVLLESHKPDIILMDIAMPLMDGIEATIHAIEKQPSVKVLALSSFGDEKYYHSMLDAGAKGFVIKNAEINELEKAIVEVANGGHWFSTELIQKVLMSLNLKTPRKKVSSIVLTDRELGILKLICQSYTNDQIAQLIHCSFDTVKWDRSNLLLKTGTTNTAGLVLYALKNKLVDL